MRLCLLILIGTLSGGGTQAAGSPAAAYESLRDDARVTKLVKEVDSDIKARRYDEALKKADEAAALRPEDPAALNAKGAALTELKRFDEAAKALDAAAAADPKAFAPQFNRGEILFLQKKYLDAALLFSELQDHFGALPLLKYKIYLCYALDGSKDRANEALASMRYPQDGEAWYFAYAAARLLDGNRGEAKRLIATADAINPKETAAYHDTLRETDLLK